MEEKIELRVKRNEDEGYFIVDQHGRKLGGLISFNLELECDKPVRMHLSVLEMIDGKVSCGNADPTRAEQAIRADVDLNEFVKN